MELASKWCGGGGGCASEPPEPPLPMVQKNPPFQVNLEIFGREIPLFCVCNLPDKHNPLSKKKNNNKYTNVHIPYSAKLSLA